MKRRHALVETRVLWSFGLRVLVLVWGFAGGAMASCNVSPITVGQKVTLAGKLQGGMVAIGSETTGWRLVYRTLRKKKSIEVDFSHMAGDKPIAHADVVVTGVIVERTYIERGAVLVLKAATWKLVGAPHVDCRSGSS